MEPIGRFLLPLLLSLPVAPTLRFAESDWSVCFGLTEESDWSVEALSAADVAILALAAVLGDGVGVVFVDSLRKNRLPEGRSFVSSLRLNRPSLGGVVEDDVASPVAMVAEADSSSPVGGE